MKGILALLMVAMLASPALAEGKKKPPAVPGCRETIEQVQEKVKAGGANLKEFRGTVYSAIMDELVSFGAPEGMKESADGLIVITDRSEVAMIALVKGQCLLGIARAPRGLIEAVINAVLREAGDGGTKL